jgi:tetratricopeptide (TPR) repeat protein
VVKRKRRLCVLDYYDLMTLSKRLTLPALLLSLTLSLPAAKAQTDAPLNSELNNSLMYELMLAEMSAYNDDPASAYQLMLDAAQKARSEQLFQRAVEIALRARAGDSALQAALAWSHALAASESANRYLLQILIGLNKLPDTVEPIKRYLATVPPKDRSAAINLLPRYFVRAADKAQAAKAVEQALAPELNQSLTGPAAHAAIGTLRLLAGDATGALRAAEKGVGLNRKAEEPVQLALALMDPQLPTAEAMVLAHLQQGARAEMHMAYVRKLLEARRYAEADSQVRQLNASAPDFDEAWLVRGSLALQDKNLTEAQAALTRFVQLRQAANSANKAGAEDDRGLAQAYFLLSGIAEQNQQPDEAERYLALIESPQDAIRVRARRAAILARQGKLDEARALIRAAPESVEEDARAKISAESQLLRDNKQFALVYAFLQEVVKTHPDDVDLRYDLAMAAEKLDKLDEMEKLLRQVIAEKPEYHHAYNALGYSLADRKLRLPEARELVRKALEFAPTDPFIQDSLGWVEFRSGNLSAAAQILQGAYQSRQDAEIAAHLGEVLWSMGQQEQARAVWKAGLSQNPDNDTLLETIKRLGPL